VYRVVTPLHSVYAVEEGKILSRSSWIQETKWIHYLRSRDGPGSYRLTSRTTTTTTPTTPHPLDLSPLSSGLFRCLGAQPGRPSRPLAYPTYLPYLTYLTYPTYLTYLRYLPYPSLLAYTLLLMRGMAGEWRLKTSTPGPHVKRYQRLAMTLVSCQTDYI
jgi:hypothetical protein